MGIKSLCGILVALTFMAFASVQVQAAETMRAVFERGKIVIGVTEALTLTGEILAAEERDDLLIPMYLYLLAWFFIYCYPIARWTQHLERKYAVKL